MQTLNHGWLGTVGHKCPTSTTPIADEQDVRTRTHIEGPIKGKMSKNWKQLERDVARLLGGSRYPANSGGRVDVESPTLVVQVKHVQRMSLAQLEALAVEMEEIGKERGKVGVVGVKRRAGRGRSTRTLIILTEAAFLALASLDRGK